MTEDRFANGPSTEHGEVQATIALWKNRYQVERELARGGFGVVYLARDQQLLSKPVVIKVLQDETGPDPYFQKKFRQEIEALARIDHPGVVGVLDVGETPDGKPFLVMQYVEGVTLRSVIPKGGMELRRVANIIRQVGQALNAAHDKGVHHRDLKPENIMLSRSGESEEYVKLIDFGIAAVRDSQDLASSLPSKVVGTLSYMAPELAMGKCSATSDTFSLGVICYEMLTGHRPEVSWEGVDRKPRELRPEIPEAAEQTILRAMSYQPEQRMDSPGEFGNRIGRELGFASNVAPPLPISPISQMAPPQSSSAGLEIAYVLFMDIVGYSRLKMDLQSQRIQQLSEIVRSTAEYQRAQQASQIISLPTGDGMALVFFQSPVAPVQCATELARALKSFPEIKLRMGVHTGPVYRIADINTNINVAGGGINLAQRVMDCGDSGHILVSRTVADILGELSDEWEPHLHDLGEAEVKHGVKVKVVNFYTGEVGNPQLPEKLRASREVSATLPAPAAASLAVQRSLPQHRSLESPQAAPAPAAQYAPAAAGRSGKIILVAAVVVVLVVIASAAALLLRQSERTQSAGASQSPPMQSSVGTPSLLPPEGPPSGPPPASPPENMALEPAATPAPALAPEQTLRTPAPPSPLASSPSPAAVAQTVQPSTQLSPQSQPTQPPPVATASAATLPPPPAELSALQDSRERLIRLAARAAAVGRSMRIIEQAQARRGVGMRRDMSVARDSMEFLLRGAKESLEAHDLVAAKRNMDLAERALDKLESFLGR